MLLILTFAAATVLLIALLVWCHAKNPSNPYLNAAKDWQTLIGALLGFIFLSASLIVSQELQSEIDDEQASKRQLAYSKILSNELNLYRQDLALRAGFFDLDGKKFEAIDCMKSVPAIQRMPLASYSLERSFPDLVPSFSDEFNFIATSAFEARSRYATALAEFDIQRCVSSPEEFQNIIRDFHSKVIAEADGMQASLISSLPSD